MSAVIRAGYKQTEVGVIPGDWEVLRLSDVAAIKAGIAKNSNALLSNPVSVHYLRVANVQDGFLNLTEMSEIRVNRNDLQRYAVLPGDVLMNEGGDLDKLGRGAIWRGEFSPCIHQNHVFVVRCNSTISPDYLNIWTGTATARRYFMVAGKQTTNLATINKTALSQLPVALPPLPEQRAIAAALSDVDALLAKLDEFIAKKRDLKQAAMQQLLTGQTRLPGFSGEWEVRALASVVANLEAGVSVNSIEYGKPLSSGEPCILKTSAIFDGRFNPEECKLIDRRDISRAKLSPRRDTLIISRMNTPNLVGEVGYVPADFPTLNLPDRLWMTRFDTGADICARWLAYVMSSAQVKENIKGLATGTSGSMKNIGKSALLALQLKFPTDEEQTAIATLLCDMDAELAALEARRDKTRALKQGMMQELLTGRIRLIPTTPQSLGEDLGCANC